MNKCYDWIVIINKDKKLCSKKSIVDTVIYKITHKSKHSHKKSPNVLFPNFLKYMKINHIKNLDLPCLHYTYVE